MKKIAVQCSYNQAHHLHIYEIINSLVVNYSEYVEIILLVEDENKLGEFECLRGLKNVKFITLKKKFSYKFLVEITLRCLRWIIYKTILRRKILDQNLIYLMNHKIVSKWNAIIYTDLINGEILKKINNDIKVIWGMHGPVGSSPMGRVIIADNVDLILSPGFETTNAFKKECKNIKQVGSIKLHSQKKHSSNKDKIFNNNNKTVIFNPHFNNSLGAVAWENFGYEILDYFKKNKNFNLIFAPHPRLATLYDLSLCEQYRTEDNIIIDIDSEKLTNLYYENYADIYMGDISSQVFEYIYLNPRKLIFFKSSELLSDEVEKLYQIGNIANTIKCLDNLLRSVFTEDEKIKQLKFLKKIYDLDVCEPINVATKEILLLLECEVKNEKNIDL